MGRMLAALMEKMSLTTSDVGDRLVLILRRDLKLGADVEIGPDVPLFGGEFDLDSLDVLLLVTSVEKEFGIKIPSEAVGQEVFQNLSKLARYITEHAQGEPAAEADLLARLPHAEPFRFVTSI